MDNIFELLTENWINPNSETHYEEIFSSLEKK